MIEALLSGLSQAMSGAPLGALAAAAGWGVLSIILSPCHVTSIPLIVGFIDEQGRMSTRRAFFISTLFAVGILVSVAMIGLLTAMAGRMLGDLGPWGNWLVAGIFFLFGLHLIGVAPLPWAVSGPVGNPRKGGVAALLFGLILGVALGPCTFAFMGPVLGVAFVQAHENLMFAAMLMFAYAIGHCSVIVLAGTCAEWVQHYLDWNERSSGAVLLKKICGVLVTAGGVWLVYSAS